jgi:hypothetical protein
MDKMADTISVNVVFSFKMNLLNIITKKGWVYVKKTASLAGIPNESEDKYVSCDIAMKNPNKIKI